MIQVTCKNCGLRILVPPTVQGKGGVCFACGGQIHVPKSDKQLQLKDLRFSAGDRIDDRYLIQAEIGSGGMGVVYKAHDELVDEEVALKFMNPRMLKTQKGQKLFIKEAQVARRLRHDNIVAVHDVSTTGDGILYLSMEFINGPSLREFLRRHRQARKFVDVRLAVDLTLQILAALEYAHKVVVHRDLKPENVMLLPGERAKVLDFGLAVAILEDPEPDAEKPKRMAGTTAYAAPEQRRQQAADFRADLYTVGLILHELLTLRTPVDEPVTVVETRQDVAPSIIGILDKALRSDRDQRWQSAGEFRETLRTAYDDSYRKISVTEVQTESGATVSTENMVYLEGGSFLMGSNDVSEERPEFETYVEPFYMDTHPVTVEEYTEFREARGHREPKFWHDPEFNGPRQPITGITWNDARAYAEWAGKQLPTEKQWEFAARGRENRKYPWGNLDPDTTRCNFGDYLGMPSIVTMHESGESADGIADLAGNVYEWTLDPFVPYDPKHGGSNPISDAPRRVARGGSWHSQASELRTTNRKGLFPESQLTTVGLRCVLPASNLRAGEERAKVQAANQEEKKDDPGPDSENL